MIDDRVDALIRRLDVPSSPDAAFQALSLGALLPRVRQARLQDRSRLGRLRRDLAIAPAMPRWSSTSPSTGILVLVAVLVLVATAAVLIVAGGALRDGPLGNGPLVVNIGGRLQAIDPETGAARAIRSMPPGAGHVSRSPDGRLVAFWQSAPAGDQLYLTDLDGGGLRPVALEGQTVRGSCVDAWSRDSRFIASEVEQAGAYRILVVDATSGTTRIITPHSVVAHCPIWSPDGAWIAFAEERGPAVRVLVIIRSDGSSMLTVSGDLAGANVDGPDSWSPDGTWISFGTEEAIWRANVAAGTSLPLSTPGVQAAAPLFSPDGTRVSFILSTPDGWDLYVAKSDGTAPRRILEQARNLGWSPDGRYVLARWTPVDHPGGLAVVWPDGSHFRVIVPSGCPVDGACDVAWGQDRP